MSLRRTVSLLTATSLAAGLVAPAQAQAPAATGAPPAAAAAGACDVAALRGRLGPDVRLAQAETIEAGGPVCRVAGTVVTRGDGAPDGSARFELNLPANWNRKLIFLGGGGFDGNVPKAPAGQLAKGYATLATDSGHVESPAYPPTGVDASWAVGSDGKPDRAKIVDYGFRSRREVDRKVRPLVSAFYGDAIRHAYFMGCSGGGREALIEAQRRPEDFSGFVAGDPMVSAGTVLLAARNFRILTQAPIPYARFAEIDRAVIADCDARDGVKDGLVQNPAACSFDPKTLAAAGVLTDAQAKALASYLTAPVDTSGRQVSYGPPVTGMGDLGALVPGMTGGLAGLSVYLDDGFAPKDPLWPWGPLPAGPINWLLFNGAIGSLALGQTNLSILDPRVSTPDGRLRAELVAEVEKNLAHARFEPKEMGRFFASGRKLIIYHGLEDTILDPYPVVGAYKAMVETAGGLQRAQGSARLFMAPGMNHCGGGYGPNAFDPLAAMEAWVEKGVAPDALVAVKFESNKPGAPVERTMPLCPFPAMARYDGKGDVRAAASWSCATGDRRMLELGPNGVAAGLRTLAQGWR